MHLRLDLLTKPKVHTEWSHSLPENTAMEMLWL